MHPTQLQAEPDEVTPAFTLRGAAVYLELHGWTKDNYYYFNSGEDDDLFPAACTLGAIGMAAFGRRTEAPDAADHLPEWPDFLGALLLLRAYLFDLGELSEEDDNFTTIGDWNDACGQTSEYVIATLNGAAEIWDRTHGGAA